ncbi:hypothetical protein QEN19_000728 [Hanseniaspora menglaensis]
MSKKLILNYFNSIVYASNVDIGSCIENDRHYKIFYVDRFVKNTEANSYLIAILSKYTIIFDSSTNTLQFATFFKLVQEILIFNYNKYCNVNNKGNLDNEIIFMLYQFLNNHA